MNASSKCVVTLVVSLVVLASGAVSFGSGPGGPPLKPAASCSDIAPSVPCFVEVSDLCSATESALSLSVRDRDSLIGKTVLASMKLELGKFADAEQKLADYESKLTALTDAPKPKISDDDADNLRGYLWSAQVCVAGL